ncbi:hypothetical protein G5714_024495 [Onychostoma macrolepis]|uniref:Uncharacterized protein n=1 Tax=Onychostoma macrolepis TaxID=369639 RepID=A0A7J6BJU7_9TELE|nr:hypothetical protein G5714_024495 [Onychostoma macrolepis]
MDPWGKKPARRRNASQLEPATSARLNPPPLSAISIAAVRSRSPAAIRRSSRILYKRAAALLQMPRRYCGSCSSPLHADDGHSECVSCLGTCEEKTAGQRISAHG